MEREEKKRAGALGRCAAGWGMTGAVFVILFFLMAFQITHSALWADEWVEYRISQLSLTNGTQYRNVIETFQPPLYNVLMHFWLKISTSVVWFRLFNLIPGMIAGLFLYRTMRLLYRPAVGRAAVLWLSVSYQWVFCIQECSEYALMLMFCFGAIFYFVKGSKVQAWRHTAALILMCVGAMYSQYGAVFLVVPLLMLHLRSVFREAEMKQKAAALGMYAAAGLLFAVPLYLFYARIQMENNKIGSSAVPLSELVSVKEIITTPGLMIRYLWNAGSHPAVTVMFQLVGAALLAGSLFLLVRKKAEREKRDLIVLLLAAYGMHYVLVKLHLYGMISPGESAGFFGRYSYFYLTILTVSVLTIVLEAREMLQRAAWKRGIALSAGAVFLLTAIVSTPKILNNWHKSYDDQFAKIWISERGYEETTFLIGTAGYGFYYYVGYGHSTDQVYGAEAIDVSDLPDRFWLWRTNWGGEAYEETIAEAKKQGYQVEEYINEGSSGQLAFCFR